MRSGILVCFEDRAVICLTQRKADHKLCKIQHLFRLRKFVFTAEKQVCSNYRLESSRRSRILKQNLIKARPKLAFKPVLFLVRWIPRSAQTFPRKPTALLTIWIEVR